MAGVGKRLQQQTEVRDLQIAGFGGLSLYSDSTLRTKETWQTLDNFDLVVDGSIRKVLPALKLAGPFTNVLYQQLEYRKAINYQGGGLRVVALDSLGNLWDVNGSTSVAWSTSLVSNLGTILDIPFMGQMQGYFIPFTIKTWLAATAYSLNDSVYRYSASDGNLYVYFVSAIAGSGTSGATEPKWPATQGSTVVDNSGGNQITWKNAGILNSQRFKLNYGIVIAKSFPAMKFVEWKYDPTNASETPTITGNRIGVSQPLTPINVTASIISPNLNGYTPISGRAYVWTYYNPNTLHDSSPAPFVGPTKLVDLDNSGVNKQLKGSLLPPLVQPTKGNKFQSYQSVYLEIPISALTPNYGDGYTCIRCWATLDNGSTFFLLNTLYNSAGAVITNGDGSIPVATLTADQVTNSWTGDVPLPTPQNAVNTARIFDGAGGAPINLAPDPANLGPASWSVVRGAALSVVPGDSPTGQAAFEYFLTATASPVEIYMSSKIAVTSGSKYSFQGYIDNLIGTGGTVEWQIVNGVGGASIANAAQANTTQGTVQALNWTAPTSGVVRIRAYVTGVKLAAGGNDGDKIELSDPIIQKGATISTTATTYPTPDSSLVLPAPAPLSQNPPPANCLSGAIFENVLFIADYNDPTRLSYSNPGDLHSYGVNSFLQFPSDRSFSIIELIPAYDRLLVSSGRAIDQVLSNSPQPGFARFPFDPQHGSLSYRGSTAYGSGVLALMDPGIAHLKLQMTLKATGVETGFTPETILSRPIKTLLDAIDPATTHLDADIPGQPVAVIDNTQDLYILGYRANVASAYMDTMVAMPLRGAALGQFSRLATLPGNGQIVSLKETQIVATRKYGVIALGGDKNVYQLFGGTQDGTITATAVSQPLPTAADIEPELWDTEKVFRELIVEGTDLTNFQFSFSADGGVTYPWGPTTIAAGQNSILLGIKAIRRLTIKVTHAAVTTNIPAISLLKLNFDVQGKAP